jgi:hypothetical protein
MANTAEIIVKVVDQSSAGLSKVNNQVNKFNRGMQQSNSLSGTLTGSILRLGATIGAAFSVKAIIDTTARFEDLRDTLTSVEGSAEGGAAAFAKIQNFATKTQFGVEDLTIAYIKLKTAGIEPTEELLTTFTDTAAVTTDQVGSLQAITDLLARTTSGGLGLEELNRLADRGVPVFKILEETLGLTRLEISEFGKTAEGAKLITDALISGLNQKFGGATQQRLDNLSVAMSNFGIAVTNSLDILGQGFSPQLTDVTNKLGEFIARNEDTIRAIGEGLGQALLFVVDNFGLFATAIGTIAGLGFIKYIQNLTIAMKALMMSNPFTAIATVATVAAYAIYDNWGGIKKWFGDLFNSLEIGWLKIKKSIYSALDAAPFADFSKEIEQTENAISNLEKEINSTAEATDNNAKSTKNADKALSDLEKQIVANTKNTKNLAGETDDLNKTTDDTNKESKDYAKTIEDLRKRKEKLQKATGKVTNAYEDYIQTLEKENELAKLTNEQKEEQIAINKALEATAKDLNTTVENLTETQRRQVEERVRGLIQEGREVERNKELQQENVRELENLYDQYNKKIAEYRNADLNSLQTYTQAVDTLYKDMDRGVKLTEEQRDAYLRGLRTQFLADYESEMANFRGNDEQLLQMYHERKALIEKQFADGTIRTEEEKNLLIEQLKNAHRKKYLEIAQSQAAEDISITDKYYSDRKALEDAKQDGIIKDYDVYIKNRRKIDKEYADTVTKEYSSLYQLLEDKTKELTGLSNKEFGLLRDGVKLIFGTDINNIIKGVFANGIGFIRNMITQGNSNFGGFAGSIGGIFSGIGNTISNTFMQQGISGIMSFIAKGLDLFGGFGGSIMKVMGDVGSWVVRSFGSIFSSLGSSISGLIGRVSGMFGGFGGGGGGIFGTIGGILDIFFAEGGVIQNGSKVNKYAKGGLVNSPTMFPMANGMGLMGEAGPEAIMPLTRINGQLGVRAEGGSSTPSIVNVNFTVNTMDARDFDTMLIQKKQLITNIVSSAVRQGNRSLA